MLMLTIDFQLSSVCHDTSSVLGLASVFALVAVAHAPNNENRHPWTEICYVYSCLGSAHAVSVKTPSNGEGLITRGDNARELSKITFIHNGFRE